MLDKNKKWLHTFVREGVAQRKVVISNTALSHVLLVIVKMEIFIMGREAGYKQCKIEKINSIASEVLSGEAGLNLHANKQVLPGGYHFQWIATGAESMGPEISISHNTLGAGVFLSSVLSRALWKSFYRVISEQQGTDG